MKRSFENKYRELCGEGGMFKALVLRYLEVQASCCLLSVFMSVSMSGLS